MSEARARLVLPVGERDHMLGNSEAPVTLVEYGDFECPYCRAAHPVVEAVRRSMGRSLRFVYRHFPLSNAHPHAEGAAEASEAAAAQGEFWPMHDLLFAHQDALDGADLVGYAEALGLAAGRFARDLSSGIYAPRVRQDFISGVRSGVNGTPTFFINDGRYDGPHDPESLTAAIDEALSVGARGTF